MIDFFAVDVGYSAVKIAFSNGDVHTFPSTVQAFINPGLLGGRDDFYVIDGKTKSVGTLSVTPSHKTNLGRHFHGGADWKALMCASFVSLAEKEGLFDPEAPVGDDPEVIAMKVQNLGVGLPFHDTTPEKAAELRKFDHFFFEFKGVPFEVEIGEMSVLHQGLAAMTLEKNLPPLVGFVDVGFYTIDIVLVEDGEIQFEYSTTYDSGVNTLHTELNRRLTSTFRIQNLKYKQLQSALQTKSLYINGKERDLTALVDECIESFAEGVGSTVRGRWAAYTDLMHQVNFTGGGSYFLDSIAVGGIYRRVEDNVFGNARGYLNIMRAWAEQGRLKAA